MEGRLKEETEQLLNRAAETLEATKLLINGKFYDDAISKAYYAMFYAASAMLVQNGIIRHKHAAAIAAVGQYFVKTGKLDAKLHKMLVAAFEDREMADYNVAWNASAEETNSRYISACTFVGEIGKILKNK